MSELDRQLDTAVSAVGGVDLHLVAVAIAFQLANLVLRSVAWRNVLRAAYPARKVPLLGVGSAYAAGVAANAVTPARGGELVKLVLLRTLIPHSSIATIAGSSAVLAVFDGVLGMALLALAASTGAVPGLSLVPPLPNMWWIAAALAVAVPVGVVVFYRARPAIGRLRRQLLAGGAIFRTPRRYLTDVATVQLGAWVCRVGVVYALLCAFDLPASLWVAALVVIVGGLATVVPATPGGLGTQQLLLVALLHGTVSAAEAISFSLTLQLGASAINVALGIAGAMLLVGTRSPVAAVRSLRQ
ncbi:MAG: lysylphosphatidylglycerol synthase domain-containing protein [Pseudomonadota bacterium]